MKKKILILSSLIMFVLIVSIVTLFYSDNDKVIFESGKNNTVVRSNALTMMYETEAGSGEYQVSKDNTWPTEGYIFNTELSSCENGSSIAWDTNTKRVVVEANSADKCYVYFDRYNIIEITNVTISKTTHSITLTVETTSGDNPAATYYFSANDGGTWESSTTNSYTYNNLNSNTEYNFKVYVTDTAGYSSSQKTVSATTDDPILLADYIKGLYTSDGTNGIYLHDGAGTYGALEAGDNSYRYAGANPNNYVCFGSDAATCPTNNLYRIIGVFDGEVKLIKNTRLGSMAWDSGNSNTWSSASLNTDTLNGTYLSGLGSTWASKIVTHTWYVGGHTTYDATAKEFYNTESNGTTWNGKVGLMYASDYGYAASSENWNATLFDYGNDTIKNNNWLYLGSNSLEWTITPLSSNTSYGICVAVPGNLYRYSVNSKFDVRPTFYLNSDVEYVSGAGTQTDPFRIA